MDTLEFVRAIRDIETAAKAGDFASAQAKLSVLLGDAGLTDQQRGVASKKLELIQRQSQRSAPIAATAPVPAVRPTQSLPAKPAPIPSTPVQPAPSRPGMESTLLSIGTPGPSTPPVAAADEPPMLAPEPPRRKPTGKQPPGPTESAPATANAPKKSSDSPPMLEPVKPQRTKPSGRTPAIAASAGEPAELQPIGPARPRGSYPEQSSSETQISRAVAGAESGPGQMSTLMNAVPPGQMAGDVLDHMHQPGAHHSGPDASTVMMPRAQAEELGQGITSRLVETGHARELLDVPADAAAQEPAADSGPGHDTSGMAPATDDEDTARNNAILDADTKTKVRMPTDDDPSSRVLKKDAIFHMTEKVKMPANDLQISDEFIIAEDRSFKRRLMVYVALTLALLSAGAFIYYWFVVRGDAQAAEANKIPDALSVDLAITAGRKVSIGGATLGMPLQSAASALLPNWPLPPESDKPVNVIVLSDIGVRLHGDGGGKAAKLARVEIVAGVYSGWSFIVGNGKELRLGMPGGSAEEKLATEGFERHAPDNGEIAVTGTTEPAGTTNPAVTYTKKIGDTLATFTLSADGAKLDKVSFSRAE